MRLEAAAVPDDLARAVAVAGDRLAPFARPLRWYAEVGSTSDVVSAMAESGASEGLVVAADHQSAGRGRLGRTWVSPPGAGVYMSVLLRPQDSALPLLTIAAGVAAAEGVEAATGLRTDVKWPNDLQVDGRKLAGILAERAGTAVVLGIGINVLPGAIPPQVARGATCIETELGRPVDRTPVLVESLAALAARYRDLLSGRRAAVMEAWRARAAFTLGRTVTWEQDGTRCAGHAIDIDESGGLLVRVGSRIVRVVAGEVQWT